MIRYLAFRHGETVSSGVNKFAGPPLTQGGEEQADKLGQRLSNFNASVFYVSDLLRSKQTADIVNRHLGLEIEIDNRLQEVGSYRMWYEVIGDEDVEAMNLKDFNKAQLGISSFLAEQKQINDGKTILLSTHGNLIKALLAITIGITDTDALNRLIVANTGLTILEWIKDDDYQLVVFNDTNHLGELIFR
ncbi:histidine phosphatase family protein [Patescibacteria group bacterium]|nr:histidine phosphatase family protein [Patescibacteria group bacterium]MBU1868360.1 histidine phosphatase family protein [Patescibacteria group bacterium]